MIDGERIEVRPRGGRPDAGPWRRERVTVRRRRLGRLGPLVREAAYHVLVGTIAGLSFGAYVVLVLRLG